MHRTLSESASSINECQDGEPLIAECTVTHWIMSVEEESPPAVLFYLPLKVNIFQKIYRCRNLKSGKGKFFRQPNFFSTDLKDNFDGFEAYNPSKIIISECI